MIQKLIRDGVPRLRHDQSAQEDIISIEMVKDSDANFVYALREHLIKIGFDVVERHPEMEVEIKSILADFPDSNPDKKDILADLESMSYLEQTALLKGLRSELNK